MMNVRFLVYLALAMTVVECKSSGQMPASAEGDSVAPQTSGSPADTDDGSGAADGVNQEGDVARGDDVPSHRFSPRPIEKKRRDELSKPDLAYALPAMKLRYNACFAPPKPIAASPVRPLSTPRQKKRHQGQVESLFQGKNGARAPSKSSSDGSRSAAPAENVRRERRQPSEPVDAMPSAEAAQVPSQDVSREDQLQIAQDDESAKTMRYDDWGASIYLSNDDSMSLSSAQRVLFAIDNFLPLPGQHIRPHELLNYFSFDTAPVQEGHGFSVLPAIKADDREAGMYNLGLSVAGRQVTRDSRRNAVLTWVLDRSGSMRAEGRMQYLKRGLKRSVSELKDGDVVNIVLFDHDVCTPLENFVVGRDNIKHLNRVIDAISPKGATNIHSGLVKGYNLADTSYVKGHSNRVVLVTDAMTNTGVTDQKLIDPISRYYESRKIRLSGVGVGKDFNDALLDSLTEKGKGAYVFLGSEAEVDAIFGYGFVSLIETTALDVRFRLHLPPSLKMQVFYGEESSVVKEDVQEIHYFANTAQLFLSDVIAKRNQLAQQDDIMLSIAYRDPKSEVQRVEEYAFNLGEISRADDTNVRKGKLIMTFVDMLAVMAQRPRPQTFSKRSSGWADPEGYQMCQDGKTALADQSQKLKQTDPEVQRVLQVWNKFCSRYQPPRKPVTRDKPKSDTLKKRVPGWPLAQPER